MHNFCSGCYFIERLQAQFSNKKVVIDELLCYFGEDKLKNATQLAFGGQKMPFLFKLSDYYNGPKSDHFDGSNFFNPWNPQTHSFFDILRWTFTSRRKEWPKGMVKSLTDTPPSRVEGNQLRISFVGHSTILIQTQALNILTDPIWSDRASPIKNLGPKRYSAPGIAFEKLPPIDVILLSHNHYDHLDIRTLKRVWDRDQPRIFTPLGNDRVVQSESPSIEVETLDWHESRTLFPGIHVHLIPCQHWSARRLFDKNKALWGAFVLTTPSGNIYFCGDSGYADGGFFRQARERFGPFRLAMLPIGAYEPRWFMKYAHMNPQEAVQAHRDLGEPHTLAMHYETFRLTDEGFAEPRSHLLQACIQQNVSANKFRPLKAGQSWIIPES